MKESANKDILLPYMLTGYYAADRLNYVDIAPDADVKVWDAASDTYKDGKNNKATILGNYVQLTDKNKDQKADLIQVVKFTDSAKMQNLLYQMKQARPCLKMPSTASLWANVF